MRYHPLAVPAAADPKLNLFDPDERHPRAGLEVPSGHLAIQMMNATSTSAGNSVPGMVVSLPDDEARALLRSGLAREVRQVPGAGIPRHPYEDPRQVYEATRRDR